MGKARLGVRLDAKSYGEIHSKWNTCFKKEFQEDRAACFTEFYFIGRSYVSDMEDGQDIFENIRGSFLSRKIMILSWSTIRVRLNDHEQNHIFNISRENKPISRRNKRALCATVASYIVIGYRHVNENVVNNRRVGEEL